MRDAIELEWEGIPSVSIIHEAVRESAESMAKLCGIPDYPFLVAGYPYVPTGVWSDSEVEDLAKQVAPGVIDLLTRQA